MLPKKAGQPNGTGERHEQTPPAIRVTDEAEGDTSDEDFSEQLTEEGPQADGASSQATYEASSKGDSKKKKTASLRLTLEQKMDVAEWYKNNEFLYNTLLDKYKDIESKASTWKEKAKELGVDDYTRLKAWVKMQCDAVGRLTDPHRKPSGFGAEELSYTQKWILANFGFVSKFIRRYDVSKRRIACTAQKQSHEQPPAIMGEGENEPVEVSSGVLHCSEKSYTDVSGSLPVSKKRKLMDCDGDDNEENRSGIKRKKDVRQLLREFIRRSITLQAWLLGKEERSHQQEVRKRFIKYVEAETMAMNDEVFFHFQMSVLKALQRVKVEQYQHSHPPPHTTIQQRQQPFQQPTTCTSASNQREHMMEQDEKEFHYKYPRVEVKVEINEAWNEEMESTEAWSRERNPQFHILPDVESGESSSQEFIRIDDIKCEIKEETYTDITSGEGPTQSTCNASNGGATAGIECRGTDFIG